MGEIRETQHHLLVAKRKGYINDADYESVVESYNEAARMLRGLQRVLETQRDRR